jgi:cyclophilin family peptidyl-prolyl cis-trans isomerase
MRKLLTMVLFVLVAAMAVAQEYAPKPGETVMRLAIEGRGNIYILLNTREAPRTASHIIKLVRSGFYDGQRFYRVVRSPRPFLIQIGDPSSRTKDPDDPTLGTGGSGTRIPYEQTSQTHEAGAVGLATLPNDRDSGDSQFYMMLAPARFLDGTYTVFGRIVEGMSVLNRIEKGDRLVAATILTG